MGGKASDLTARGQSGGSGTAQRLGGVTPGLGDDWITHMRGRPRQPGPTSRPRPRARDHANGTTGGNAMVLATAASGGEWWPAVEARRRRLVVAVPAAAATVVWG